MANTLVKELTRFVDAAAIEGLLRDIGLQRRAGGAFSAFGVFTVGMVVGAAVSLLLAPKAGVELRNDLAQRVSTLRDDMEQRVQAATKKGERYNPPS